MPRTNPWTTSTLPCASPISALLPALDIYRPLPGRNAAVDGRRLPRSYMPAPPRPHGEHKLSIPLLSVS